MSKPKALFIFGGTGDLARKKLFPALARIAKRRDDLKVVYSIARSKREDWEGSACNLDAGFTKLCHYIPLDAVNWEDYKKTR
jgi:glucose-6-phosphate 1-dehydrogenase